MIGLSSSAGCWDTPGTNDVAEPTSCRSCAQGGERRAALVLGVRARAPQQAGDVAR
ncbi:hypothetical protein [Actinomadura rubteroloni]|uniref:hypothetical protein n=1 Tax=Actinomadura rubteroloni TaxID=1926885 RepID=UPI00143D68FD|nr:hypothetical protein [Actinomadura rubteroloni]